jgi:hypothetical protein
MAGEGGIRAREGLLDEVLGPVGVGRQVAGDPADRLEMGRGDLEEPVMEGDPCASSPSAVLPLVLRRGRPPRAGDGTPAGPW